MHEFSQKTNSLFFLVHQTHGGCSKSNPKGDIVEKNNNTVICNKNEDKGNFEYIFADLNIQQFERFVKLFA